MLSPLGLAFSRALFLCVNPNKNSLPTPQKPRKQTSYPTDRMYDNIVPSKEALKYNLENPENSLGETFSDGTAVSSTRNEITGDGTDFSSWLI